MNVLTTERQKTRPQRPLTPRPVPELLLELTYRLHATRAVATKSESDWRPRKSR